MIPVYGFVAGDSLGVLVLIGEDDTIAELALRLQQAVQVRVALRVPARVVARGKPLEPDATVKAAGLAALDRVDLVPEERIPDLVPGELDAGRAPEAR